MCGCAHCQCNCESCDDPIPPPAEPNCTCGHPWYTHPAADVVGKWPHLRACGSVAGCDCKGYQPKR